MLRRAATPVRLRFQSVTLLSRIIEDLTIFVRPDIHSYCRTPSHLGLSVLAAWLIALATTRHGPRVPSPASRAPPQLQFDFLSLPAPPAAIPGFVTLSTQSSVLLSQSLLANTAPVVRASRLPNPGLPTHPRPQPYFAARLPTSHYAFKVRRNSSFNLSSIAHPTFATSAQSLLLQPVVRL